MLHRSGSAPKQSRGALTVRVPARPGALLRVSAVLGACLALLTTLLVTFGAGTASAHGAVSDPPARQYACYHRWPNGPTQQMATEDPMCYKAWQTDSSAMYNWNGLFREGVAGRHESVIPDGQLCSAGLAHNGRYGAFDEPGNWKTVDRPAQFTLNLHDQSSHGADYMRVYATRQGFDPKTQKLRWSDLELVGQTGRIATGSTTPVQVNAPGRTGHHVLYTVWQASHLDQSYYFCSDVNFTGGGQTTTTTTTTTTTSTTTTTTTDAPPRGCSATLRTTSQWNGGFQAEVRVTAGSAAVSGWAVTWTFANGERINSIWSAAATTSGTSVTARNVNYNGSLGAGASTTFGFVASGTLGTPSLTCTAS